MPIRIYKLLLVILILGIFSLPAYSSSDWNITLKVTGGGVYDYCIAGVRVGATDGHDNTFDVPLPPSSLLSTYINTYFPHAEWGNLYSKMRRDIKAPYLPKEWVFEVNSNVSGELTIQWPDLKNAIPDKKAVLVDIDGGGGEINMQISSSFVFENTGSPRRFLMRVSQGIPGPQPPEAVKGKLMKNETVRLNWKRSTESDLAGYNVYRSTIRGSGYQKINYLLIGRNTYRDKQIELGKTYYYVVTAINKVGGESGCSNEVVIIVK